MEDPAQAEFNRAEFEALVERYADRLYNVALRIIGQPQDAEDALQEAFLLAFRSWGRFRGEASRATWLYRIVVNASLQRLRDRHPSSYLEDLAYDDVEIRDWSASVMALAETSELREHLLAGIDRLPPTYREVIVLRDIDGLSTSEAALILELNEATLKTRLQRARGLLRKHLADFRP
ncbi:MAG: sigma-70 family RNA polymerase sigma factor [Chloroflexi bacterium]|nr:sigma-70 family RNA polymerase sigma factor [Chloroflexota bacterium]